MRKIIVLFLIIFYFTFNVYSQKIKISFHGNYNSIGWWRSNNSLTIGFPNRTNSVSFDVSNYGTIGFENTQIKETPYHQSDGSFAISKVDFRSSPYSSSYFNYIFRNEMSPYVYLGGYIVDACLHSLPLPVNKQNSSSNLCFSNISDTKKELNLGLKLEAVESSDITFQFMIFENNFDFKYINSKIDDFLQQNIDEKINNNDGENNVAELSILHTIVYALNIKNHAPYGTETLVRTINYNELLTFFDSKFTNKINNNLDLQNYAIYILSQLTSISKSDYNDGVNTFRWENGGRIDSNGLVTNMSSYLTSQLQRLIKTGKLIIRYRSELGTTCSVYSSPILFNLSPIPYLSNKLITSPSCQGQKNGAINLSSLNNQDYAYKFAVSDAYGSASQSTIIKPLNGTYTIPGIGKSTNNLLLYYATDNILNCPLVLPYEVGERGLLTTSEPIKNPVTCVDNSKSNGSVSIKIIAGSTDNYTASLTGKMDQILRLNETATFTGLSKGSYTLTIKDDCAVKTFPIEITAPDEVQIQKIDSKTQTCEASPNGEISFYTNYPALYCKKETDLAGVLYTTTSTSAEVNAPFPYKFTLKGLKAEIQTWHFSNPNYPCFEYIAKVDYLNKFFITPIPDIKNVSCFGGSDGAYTLNITGGSSNAYLIDDKSISLPLVQSNLKASSTPIVLKVKTSTCSDTRTVSMVITQPSLLTESLVPIMPTCYNGSNGMIQIKAFGGTAPYSFTGQIKNGTNIDVYLQMKSAVDSMKLLTFGEYQIKVKDAKNCVTSLAYSTIINPASFKFDAVNTEIYCPGGEATVSLSVESSINPVSYSYKQDTISKKNPITGSTIKFKAGFYNFSATNSKGCIENKLITLLNPAPFTVQLDSYTAPTCFGKSDASITLKIKGGHQSDTIPFINFNLKDLSNSTITTQKDLKYVNYKAGRYIFSLQSRYSCTANGFETVTITDPQPLSLTVTASSNQTCTGENGSASVQARGGTSKYKYSSAYSTNETAQYPFDWTNVVTINGVSTYLHTQKNLKNGVWNFSVVDINACSAQTSVNIGQTMSLITAVSSVTTETCFGVNGTAKLSSNGRFPIKYEFKQDTILFNIPVSNVITGLSAGLYKLKVVDANECIALADVTIGKTNTVLTYKPIIIADTCKGLKGKVIITPINGKSPFTVSLTKGSITANGSLAINGKDLIATNLQYGTYTLALTDANKCLLNSSLSISTVNPIVALTATIDEAPKCKGNFGQVSLIGKSTNQVQLYSIDGVNYNTPSTFSNLTDAKYTFFAKDINGCLGNKAVYLNRISPTIEMGLITQADTCMGSRGLIRLTPSKGVAPYQTFLDDKATGADTLFQFLIAKTYKVKLQDRNLCSDSVYVSLNNYAPVITTEAKVFNANCSLMNGRIQLTTFGGFPPYLYGLQKRDYKPETTIENLSPFEGFVYVKDRYLCADSVKVKINSVVSDFNTLFESKQATCTNNNGSIFITASNGTPRFMYKIPNRDWISFKDTVTITGLVAGTYEVAVQNELGCTKTKQVVVNKDTTNFAYKNVSYSKGTCIGIDNATVNLTTEGGTNPITYTWNNNSQLLPVFTKVRVGTSVFTAIDNNGCIITKAITIEPANAVSTISTVITNPTCYGSNNGKIVVNAIGRAPFTMSLNDAVLLNQSTFLGLVSSTYKILVKDNLGCLATSSAIVANPVASMSLSSTIKAATCVSSTDGSLTVSVASGGTSPFKYQLGANVSQTSNAFLTLAPNNYLIRVTDANGCAQTINTVVASKSSNIVINTATKIDVNCFGESNGAIILNATNGTAPLTYKWEGTVVTGPTLSGLKAGAYKSIVSDAYGCTQSLVITINQPTSPLKVKLINPGMCAGSSSVELKTVTSGGSGKYFYTLEKISPTVSQIIQTVPNYTVGLGFYKLKCIDMMACVAQDTTTVRIVNSLGKQNFLVSTTSLTSDTLVIKDITYPKPDSIQWSFDPRLVVISKTDPPLVKMGTSGSYYMNQRVFYKACPYDITKDIKSANVTKSMSIVKLGVDSILISPNPTSGVFKVKVILPSVQDVSLSISSMNGTVVESKIFKSTATFEDSFDLGAFADGDYIVKASTGANYKFKVLILLKK